MPGIESKAVLRHRIEFVSEMPALKICFQLARTARLLLPPRTLGDR